uniref:Uncharacterized protein n=1 Tax=Arundo donax TaxID=35708 RepID=A0A0A9DQQ5_ARUDO
MITAQTLQSISRAPRAFCNSNPISSICPKLSAEPRLLPTGLPLVLGSLFSINNVRTMVIFVIMRNRSGLVPTNTLVTVPPMSRPQFERTTRKATAMDAKKRLLSVADMALVISCGVKFKCSFRVSTDQPALSAWFDWLGGADLGLISISLLGWSLAAPSLLVFLLRVS